MVSQRNNIPHAWSKIVTNISFLPCQISKESVQIRRPQWPLDVQYVPVFQKSSCYPTTTMGSCLYTLSSTQEQWSESQVSHVMWDTPHPTPTKPYLIYHLTVLLPGLFIKWYATLHWKVLLFLLDLLNLAQTFGWIFSLLCGVVCARVLACSILYKEWSGGSAGQGRRTLPESAHTPIPRAFERAIQTHRPRSCRTSAHLYWQTYYHTYILGLLLRARKLESAIKCTVSLHKWMFIHKESRLV